MHIGFQGIHGAYSEVAIYSHFGKRPLNPGVYPGVDPGFETIGFETFQDVADAVKRKEIDCALLPVENSIVGSISENIDILIREDLYIIAEVYLRIRHHLLANKGALLSGIKQALSHPAALSQCKDYLRMNGIKALPVYDTAGAARMISEQNNFSQGAVASELCAELYSLDVLGRDIQSFKDNFTRFFVAVRKEDAPKEIKREKTSVVFKTYHRPGALAEILQIFSKHRINMTKLESRPIPENPWQYSFLVDFEGGLYDPSVLAAIAEIGAATPFHKVLGSYPKGDKNGN